MAGTLFLKAISATGLKIAAFLQSLFLFPVNTLLQVVDLVPFARRTSQPILPCSTAGSGSSTPPSSRQPHDDVDAGGRHAASDMMAASSSSAASDPANPKTPVPGMASISPPNPPAGKLDCSPTKADSPAADAQLSGVLSRLELNDNRSAAPTTPLHDGVNGTGAGAAQNGTFPCYPGPNGTDSATARGVTPALPGSLECSAAQTSKSEETAAMPVTTTIQLGSDTIQIQAKHETPEQAAERAKHSRFMREALDMARLALRTNETPVGCVLVYKERVIAKGMNATNVTRNGTRHAELMAISALLSYSSSADLEPATNGSREGLDTTRAPLTDKTNEMQPAETSTWGDVDPRDGHLYPYGQKLHPSPRVDISIIRECTLYVTVEPCVMCASLLRQLGIKKVYFGAVNDKFGGTGGVFRIHKNSPRSMASAPPTPTPQKGKGLARPVLERLPASTDGVSDQRNAMEDNKDENGIIISHMESANLPGDGGNIERGFEAEGGWGRDEAVTLLRQFYVQENNRAPVPRKKEGRAARLAAMMERDGHAGGPMIVANAVPTAQGDSGSSTTDDQESNIEATAEDPTAAAGAPAA
ncbi:f1c30c48-de3e-41b2-bd67-83cf0e89a9ba [Thermothielavioides terrestris]|uniref:CMP/dCMP-type deaminase domain-containing protein n=2 Tax=Thermothielavioides terrestris TaxID=2587410 RepID=G2R279_THETT|nr:uncharacterized protein THITE_2111344 [Thermothielavioides terrestris NRRL 8126]AEO64947.1 hypothetical protein THITE_2111344 [Thermothielavioides terrestris NRRL 8126]SPQ19796.1 f1c30c48-de3e-41b2-bd67-83cf0e89a9ba [Thermothielavioides terrestris]